MSSNELANFAANAQTPNGHGYSQQVNPSNGTIQLTPEKQQYILNQLSQLVDQQASAQPRGFTTVSLAPRTKPQAKSEQTNSVTTKRKSTEQAPETSKSEQSTQDQNNTDDGWMMGAVKKIGAKQRQERIQQTSIQPQAKAQVQQPQRKSIQTGQFGSAQVQYASYIPSSANHSYSMIRPTASNAPTIQNTQFYARGPATIRCVIEAAKKHNVPPHVLLGIASKERGQNGQTVKNSNATYDLGHFQLNTIHFKPGQAFGHIDLNDARWRGCYNAELAAWHLNKQLTLKSKQSENFWTKAGGYHSWTPKYNRIYVYGTTKNKGLIHYAQEWQKWLANNPTMNF